MICSIFADSNLFLDAYLNRSPHYGDCNTILQLGIDKEIKIYTSSSCLLTVMYFLKKDGLTKPDIIKIMTATLRFCKIICTTEDHFTEAFTTAFTDLEDAVQYHTALQENDIDYFITSNIKDFKKTVSSFPVVTPKQFMILYKKKGYSS
ncbi:MAG: PIN domain-containing protein [Chitinophagaceae bacterium]|nr:PIN domain-containing protein [Chitinophagaceae bacterium]